MNAPIRSRLLSSRTPLRIALVVGLACILAGAAGAQTCDITSTPAQPSAGQPFTLCGPSGVGYAYTWFDSLGNVLGSDRCLAYAGGLSAGTYDWMLFVSGTMGMALCPYQLTVSVPAPSAPVCQVTLDPAGMLCGGQSFTLCAPDGQGLTYTWYGPDNSVLSHDRCVVVAGGRLPGSWAYRVDVTANGLTSTCAATVVVADCAPRPNCPRGAGWWAQQCAQKGNGSTPIGADRLNAVASAVDGRSAFFTWGASSDAFCATINPAPPMDARKQAKRQFATLLANLSAGALGLMTRGGDPVSLDPGTPVSYAGMTAATLGDLAAETDGLLAQLESQPLGAPGVSATYGHIADACDAANNGVGIGPVCPSSSTGAMPAMLQAAPNPFSASTQVSYSVQDAVERVDIAVYDVSGRVVRRLASGTMPAGQYQVRWDGRNEAGLQERSGVFFVRGTIGDRPIAARLLLLR